MKRNDTAPTQASRQYAAAHEAHYGTKNLRDAITLYRDIMAAYPETPECGYSRSQIQNIVKAVVPKQELLDAEVALSYAFLGRT